MAVVALHELPAVFIPQFTEEVTSLVRSFRDKRTIQAYILEPDASVLSLPWIISNNAPEKSEISVSSPDGWDELDPDFHQNRDTRVCRYPKRKQRLE